jgi:capsular polysaccharide biosynthesis protein
VTADLARQQAPERIKVIDRPFEPTAPIKPMTMIFALAGIAAGLALGIGLAALFDLMDGSLRGIRATEKLLGVPVLARLPRIRQEMPA